MTFAWYGHLKKDLTNISLIKLVFISWGIAFFEYCFMVPANNKYGALEGYSPFQLKTLQELISLLVFFFFAMFFLVKVLNGTTCFLLYSLLQAYFSCSINLHHSN